MDDSYQNIEEYNRNKKRKILLVFDDKIADMLSNKKAKSNSNWRGSKLNISLVFITQSYFPVWKNIRLILYILVESKYRFQDASTDFIKEVRNLWILEAATDKRSGKIGILKSMIKLLEKYPGGNFSSKATGNSLNILLKINSFTNIFQGFQSRGLT